MSESAVVDATADAEARDLTYHGKNHGDTGRDKVPNIWGVVPIGGIIMWSGAVAKIPAHWALCDGTNGTPDLRGRFVYGAGGAYAVGATGGSENLSDHTHAFTQPSAHVITQPVFAGPTGHNITQPVIATVGLDHNHDGSTVTAHGDHSFQIIEFNATGLVPGATGIYALTGGVGGGTTNKILTHTQNHTVAQPTGHTAHAHTLSTNVALDHNHDAPARTTDVALSNNSPTHAGGAVGAVVGTVTQLPPYYALAFIQRLS